MLDKYVVPGQRIDLKAFFRHKKNDDEEIKTYETKIYDVIGEDRLEVHMPMENAKLILLPVDAEYQLYFYTEAGLYECIGRIIDRYKSNNVYILLFEMLTNLRKYQRREYYRYSCALNMDTRNMVDEEIQAVEKNRTLVMPGLPLKHSVVVDISGGGLRFVSSYKYEKGSIIYCNYQLMIKGSIKNYNIASRILDVKELENRPGEFEHRVKYINLDNEEREEIIQYIFEEERKNLRKGRPV